MTANRERTTRRGVLAGAGAAALVSIAGCVGGDEENGNESTESNGNESTGNDGGADSDNGGESTDEEASVTVLVEMTGGTGGNHESHDHEEEGHDHEEEGHNHDEEGHNEGKLAESTISHTCGHFEEIDEFGVAETVEGPTNPSDAMEITNTHTTYEVTFEGDSTYVMFHTAEEHKEENHDGHEEESHDDHDHEEENHDNHDHEEENHDGHNHEEENHDGHNHEEENHSDHDHEEKNHDNHDHGGAGGEMVTFFTRGGSPSVETGTEVYHESDEQQCGPMDQYVVVEPEGGEAIVELSPDL